MNPHLRSILLLLGLSLGLCCVLYPLLLLGVGQAFFPGRANGSLLLGEDGRPVGSRLIAQPFEGDAYFHPRPSAVSYNAAAAGGSNYGASNPALRRRVEEDLARIRKANPAAGDRPVPADLVMASGSGLDPHITLEAALFQLDRVAAAWAGKLGADEAEVRRELEALLRDHAEAPLGGLAGVEMVNVLEVNRALPDRLGAPR